MDLHQLRYFVAVAEELSFTNGARREQVAQSAVSKAVSRLEREFGLDLFTRIGRGVALTSAGERLLPQARSILQSAADTKRQLSDLRERPAGVVKIAVGISTGGVGLADALSGIRFRYPDICVRLLSAPHQHDEHAVALQNGIYDLAVVSAPTVVPPEIDIAPLGTVGPVLATAATASNATTSEPMSMSQVSHRPFVDFPPSWAYRSFTDTLFTVHNVQRHVCFQVESVWAAVELIAADAAIGFLPLDVVQGLRGTLSQAELDFTPERIKCVLLSHKQRVPQAVTAVRDAIASLAHTNPSAALETVTAS